MNTLTFIEPLYWYKQLEPTSADASKINQVWCLVEPDGISPTVVINHKLHISAADLVANYPTVEIVNPNNSPTSPYTPTLATHTTLTGLPSQLGVTVSTSLTNTLTLAIATPAVAQGAGPAAAFMVVITRNPASAIPLP